VSFASPGLLWALPAAAAPLLLHLFSRRRARRLAFGDLTLLRQVHAKALPRARLRQWLLVAARCGLIFFLILAYAGPVLEEKGPRGGGPQATAAQGLDLVILLDGSYSMGVVEGGRRRFDRARDAASDLLRSLTPLDRVAFGVFSDRLETEGETFSFTTPGQALTSLGRSAPGFRGTDYAVALRAAYSLAAVPGRRRAVLLLTDGARHGLRGPLPPEQPGVPIYALSWEGRPENSFILSSAPAPESTAAKPRLRARTAAAAATSLELWLGGRRAQALALGRSGEAVSSFSLPPGSSWEGQVALRPDALPADDVFFYSFSHPRRPRVLCLHGNPDFFKAPSAGYFLQELFGKGEESLLEYDADFLELGRLREARLSDYAAVLLTDFKEVPPAAAAELERFVRRGGGLWLLPGGRTAREGFASLSWLPAEIGPAASGSDLSGLAPEAVRPEFKRWKGFELERVAIGRRHELTPRPGAEVLLRSTSGRPLLVSGLHGRGRTALWASSLDTGWSNLAVKPVFAAWVGAVLSLVCSPSPGSENFSLKVGEPIVRFWGASEPAPARVRLRAPEGRMTTLWLKDRKVESGALERPGLYTLTEEGSAAPPRQYAVNADRSGGESDLSLLGEPPWKPLRVDALRRDFWLAVRGRDARPAALMAAAALLLAEMFLCLPKAAAILLLILGLAAPSSAQQGDRFVWTQLKLGPTWDPYPSAPAEALELFSTLTSVLTAPQARSITLKDPALFSSPLVILAGREAPPPLDSEELSNLRNYLAAGGMLWAEDTSGTRSSSFDRWLRGTLKEALPESELAPIEFDHAVYRSFFLLRAAVGRLALRATLEGLPWSGRMAVVYSRNDLLGLWVKDALGRPLLPCLPGGEPQRHNGRKLTLNILMYSLTGSYKSDAVHQPYLLQKMRSGEP
jgi:uncharacterized membrane protein